ncbi:DUF6286 domain-containing protein [Citricoccus muralis]|uniref:DUF6286 domain-containing protein n=1 Tax=Citricoccus muralis TaxID=169134 RepID=A0ABY8H6E3_9MICC|nr:DUF6286 domain-containing protein [Citricoccus muralis]WFP16496.1 DUF6286 domain-containing protein [Citricoccus muralis]
MKHLRRRPPRTAVSLVVAVVVVAIAGATLWAGLTALFTGDWPPAVAELLTGVSDLSWNGVAGWSVAVVAALVGLVLVLCAVIPGAQNAAPLDAPEPTEATRTPVEALLLTQGMATLVSAVAAQVDGVAGVRTSAGPRSVVVTVTTPLRETETLVAEVREHVEQRLAGTGLTRVPRVRVTAQVKEAS